MSRTALLAFASVVACGDSTATSAGSDGSTGASSSTTHTAESSSSGSTSASFDSGGPSNGSSDGTTSGSESSTGSAPHCQVEVVESLQLSPERFGTLTLASGHPDLVVLGSLGWTMAGSVEAPHVARFAEPAGEFMAGRFGPEGGWAYAERGRDLVTVWPLDDPGAMYSTGIPGVLARFVGDIDEDGLDDLISTEDGSSWLWRADDAGGFVRIAESAQTCSESLCSFAPATDWAPAAVLRLESDAAVAGLELEGDVLEKAYTVETSLMWSIRGVEPPGAGGRSFLVAREGGILLDPLEGYVGFIDGQEGGWTRRGVDLGARVLAAPQAVDLDADDVLDAVAATSGPSLRGACSEGDTLLPCLEAPLTGTPESIAVAEGGLVFVATEDEGLWVHRLGDCL